jgi:RNA recognition motif 2
MIAQPVPVGVYSPNSFKKMHSNSHDVFRTVDYVNYSGFQRGYLAPPNTFLNNTTPLPDMSSLNRKVNCSPDFNMQQYQYFNANLQSTGRISSNCDYIPQSAQTPVYYHENMGSSWPKISHPSEQPQVSAKSRMSGRVITKESEKQKQRYVMNIQNILNGKDKRTSLMIRNIPNKYTQVMLTQELDEKHKGLYDIIYLPIDPKNRCNCGYAFINVVHPAIILSLYLEFNGKSWRNFNSEKICELTYGRLQGKDQLLKQLEGSGVMQQNDSAKKPLILETIEPTEEQLDKIRQEFNAAYGFS